MTNDGKFHDEEGRPAYDAGTQVMHWPGLIGTILIIAVLCGMVMCSIGCAPTYQPVATQQGIGAGLQDLMPPWHRGYRPFEAEIETYFEEWSARLGCDHWNIDRGYADLAPNYLGSTWMFLEPLSSSHAFLRITPPEHEIWQRSAATIKETIIHELMHLRVYEVAWIAKHDPEKSFRVQESLVREWAIVMAELERLSEA